MAIGLLSAFQEMGVRVPGDIAVGGFDDIPIARFMTPPLSSVAVSIADLGARAMERLLTALEGSRAATFPAMKPCRPASSRGVRPAAAPRRTPASTRHSHTRRKDQ